MILELCVHVCMVLEGTLSGVLWNVRIQLACRAAEEVLGV